MTTHHWRLRAALTAGLVAPIACTDMTGIARDGVVVAVSERPYFHAGEPVNVTVTNLTTETVYCDHCRGHAELRLREGWSVHQAAAGRACGPLDPPDVIDRVPIEPGESHAERWIIDARDLRRYRVVVTLQDGTGGRVARASPSFLIVGPPTEIVDF